MLLLGRPHTSMVLLAVLCTLPRPSAALYLRICNVNCNIIHKYLHPLLAQEHAADSNVSGGHNVCCHAGNSGLPGSRLDDTLPLLPSHMLSAGLPGHAGGLEQQQWAFAAPDMADQATATSPLHPHPHPPVRHPPVRSSSSLSGLDRVDSS